VVARDNGGKAVGKFSKVEVRGFGGPELAGLCTWVKAQDLAPVLASIAGQEVT